MKARRTLLALALALLALAAVGCSARATPISTGAGSATTARSATTIAGSVVTPPAPPDTGSTASSVSSPVPPTTTTVKPLTRAPVVGVVQLTATDSNRAFEMRVGQTVELTLSTEGMQWGPVKDTPAGLLIPRPSPAPPAHGQLVVWNAATAGTVKLTAVGTAYCPAGTACPMYAALFNLTLVIS